MKELVAEINQSIDLDIDDERALAVMSIKKLEKKFDVLWEILINLYLIWIEPSAIKEVTSQSLINVKEIYEHEIAVFKLILLKKDIYFTGILFIYF